MLRKGDMASEDDAWFRYATAKGHITRGGRIHHGLFRGRNGIAPPAPVYVGRWKSEISGRLQSFAGSGSDVYEEGCRRVKNLVAQAEEQGKDSNIFEFRGIAKASVSNLRSLELTPLDVIYDPTEEPIADPAHANLVFVEIAPEQLRTKPLTYLEALINQLTFIHAEQIFREHW